MPVSVRNEGEQRHPISALTQMHILCIFFSQLHKYADIEHQQSIELQHYTFLSIYNHFTIF